jgi:hypothetical protein
MCNRLIKFGAFDEKRGHNYDLIATGHYAQTEICPSPSEGGVKWLCTSPDPVKDQTDFLAQIHDWQLRKALFPIGHYMKDEVRQIAEREHLVNARRKDSQGICFLGKINYNDYIRRYLGELPGDVIELETGKLIGRHKGLWFHTIGQRKGLGFGGGPWFVVKKDVQLNILYVSHGYDPATAYSQHFKVRDIHWLTMPVCDKDVTFNSGSVYAVCASKNATATSNGCTSMGGIGKLTMNGTIRITYGKNHALQVGDSIRLWTVASFTGNPQFEMSEGITWDTSRISEGLLIVKDIDLGIGAARVDIDPNAVYDLMGRKVRNSDADLNGLPSGIYVRGGKKFVVK